MKASAEKGGKVEKRKKKKLKSDRSNFDVGKGSPVIHKLTGGELPTNK
ncbi:hypothetical protein [Okeania sp. SIO2B3]|nr:hypothetical protein [Okeania sp. SIO2B3]NET43175.1 hypothetical protein [Okeania sp. SIO2B3]